MKVIPLPLDGAYLLEPVIFSDERGLFLETYNKLYFNSIGISTEFVQDNQSVSHKGVLRGLHFQKPPYQQGKLVRVVYGAVLDVIVDIRKESPTYGQHFKVRLDHINNLMMWIPPGLAHGFVAMEDHTIFHYKVTNVYNKNSEDGIRWNDPELDIQWEIEKPIVSTRDAALGSIKDLSTEF